MTTYTPIANGSVDSGSPIDESLVTALRDNPIAISEGSTGAPKIQTAAYEDRSVTNAKLRQATAGDFVILAKMLFKSAGSISSWTTYHTYKIYNNCSLKLRSGAWQQDNFQNVGTRFLINGTDAKAQLYSTSGGSIAETVSLSQGDVVEFQAIDLETNASDSRFNWWIGVSNPAGLFGANISNANSNQNSTIENIEYVSI